MLRRRLFYETVDRSNIYSACCSKRLANYVFPKQGGSNLKILQVQGVKVRSITFDRLNEVRILIL